MYYVQYIALYVVVIALTWTGRVSRVALLAGILAVVKAVQEPDAVVVAPVVGEVAAPGLPLAELQALLRVRRRPLPNVGGEGALAGDEAPRLGGVGGRRHEQQQQERRRDRRAKKCHRG